MPIIAATEVKEIIHVNSFALAAVVPVTMLINSVSLRS